MTGELRYQLILQNSRYLKELHEARRETTTFDRTTRTASSGTAGLGSAALRATPYIVALAAAGRSASAAFAEFANQERLELGLQAIMGSATLAKARLLELRQVAKMPGLGFQEAVQGDIRLQAVGFSADRSRRLLLGFGNALATVGGSKAQLDGVITALSQMAAKGKVSAEEINQIAERVPQIRAVMQEAFGTADTEVLQRMGLSVERFVERVVGELEKLPVAASGAANATENLGDAWSRLKASIGGTFGDTAARGIAALADGMEDFSAALDDMDLEEKRQLLAEAAAEQERAAAAAARQAAETRRVQQAAEASAAAAAREAERREQIATRQAEIARRREAEGAAVREAEGATQEIIFDATLSDPENIQRQIDGLLRDARLGIPLGNSIVAPGEINDARSLAEVYNRIKARLDAPTRIAIAERISQLVRLEEQLARIKADQAAQAEREAQARERTAAAQAEAKADFEAQNAILRARAAGNEKLAQQLERQARVESLKQRLMREQGLAAEEALRLAKERIALEERAAKPAEKKRGLKSAEESAIARFERMSPADRARVGDFEGFLRRDNTTRLQLLDSARKAAGSNLAGGGAPGSDRRRESARLETFAERQTRELAAINSRLQDLGLAAV